MKIIRSYCVLIILLFTGLNVAFAQQQTPYQKKSLEIKKKYVKKILMNQGSWTNRNDSELFYADEDYINTALALGLMGSPKYIESLKAELNQAEKLKTAVDYKREKDAKARKEQEIKTEKDKKDKKEKEQKIQDQKDAFDKTDRGSIKQLILNAFNLWNQKGEFEKEIDYKERLETKSQTTFSQICNEQIKSKIDNYNIDYYLKRELSIYNSENESFNVTFKINGLEYQNSINIPIEKAKDFKNSWPELTLLINDYDWSFVNNNLCPKLVILKNDQNKYEFPISIKDQSEIIYSFDNFEINNSYLKNIIFNYSDEKRKNSLNYDKYSQKLDSIFKEYNRQLLENPNNTRRITLTDYTPIENNGFLENKYNISVNSIKTEFLSLNNSFKEELENQNKIKLDDTIHNPTEIEVKPDFPGGIEKFYSFMSENYITPKEEGLAGKVYITFVVEKDGSLSNIVILRDIGYGTGKEALRVLKICPKWIPGEIYGIKVRCKFSTAINIDSKNIYIKSKKNN